MWWGLGSDHVCVEEVKWICGLLQPLPGLGVWLDI